jgi:hypothetical protein
VAVDARDGVLHHLAHLHVRHVALGEFVEALHQVSVTKFVVERDDRRVTVDAHIRRIRRLSAGISLIVEHVGVSATLAVVLRERVAGPHRFQARIHIEFLARDDGAGIGVGRRLRHSLAAAVLGADHVGSAEIKIVLQREVLAPYGWVVDGVVEFDDAIERVLCFLLALEDVDEQGSDSEGRNGREYDDGE